MRIVSLLPAATEIVAALGCVDQLVGVTHECDYPPEAQGKPCVLHSPLHEAGLSSAEIDQRVREALTAAGTLYVLNEPLLRELRPDVILTQRLCDVCAIGYDSVAALAQTLPCPPHVLNLEPQRLADVLEDIGRVGDALGVPERAAEVVAGLQARIRAVSERAGRAATRPRLALLEWLDPLFCGGHWNPELVEIAGAVDPLGRGGGHSAPVNWDAVRDAQPEMLLLACCGYSVERTLADVPLLTAQPGWEELPAVRAGRIYVADGSAYFARPGPRLVDSLEIVAQVAHPELFADLYPLRGVQRHGQTTESCA